MLNDPPLLPKPTRATSHATGRDKPFCGSAFHPAAGCLKSSGVRTSPRLARIAAFFFVDCPLVTRSSNGSMLLCCRPPAESSSWSTRSHWPRLVRAYFPSWLGTRMGFPKETNLLGKSARKTKERSAQQPFHRIPCASIHSARSRTAQDP